MRRPVFGVLAGWALALGVMLGCGAAYGQNQVQPFFSLSPSNNTNMQGVNVRRGLPVGAIVVATCGTPPSTYTAGQAYVLTMDTTGAICVNATLTPSGTQNVNLTQILGAAPSLTNPIWVFPATGASWATTSLSDAPVAPATATATKSTLGGCQATSAAINPTTGQQAAVDCDLNNNLLVSSGGAPNFTTGQVTVTTGSTATCAARALRRACTITNITGTQQVYCSGTTATTGNGQLIPAAVGASFTVNTTAAVNCIAVSSSQTVSVAETY